MDSWHVRWTLYHWDILLWSIHVEKYTDVSFLMKSWSWIYKFINNRLVLAISLLGEAETLPWRFSTSPYRSAECLGTKVRREELYLLDQNTKPRNVFEGRTLVISKGHSLTGKVGGAYKKRWLILTGMKNPTHEPKPFRRQQYVTFLKTTRINVQPGKYLAFHKSVKQVPFLQHCGYSVNVHWMLNEYKKAL